MRASASILIAIVCPVLLTCSSPESTAPAPAAPAPPASAAAGGATEPSKARPPSGLQGLDGEGKMQISAADRCPVCAMKVAEHPKFSSALELDDGQTYYFCGTGCLIRSWLHPEVYLGAERSRLRRARVREYFTGEQIDALAAHWVAGSDVVGPMGPALVPLADDGAVSTFRERHGGRHVFKIGDLDDARWLEITGKPAIHPDRAR